MEFTKKYDKMLNMYISNAVRGILNKYFFELIKENGLDMCHRCKQKINTYEELSIDHIKDWQPTKDRIGSATDYYDIKNIAYSHYGCNSTANLGKTDNRYMGITKRVDKRKEPHRVFYEAIAQEKSGKKHIRTVSLCRVVTQEEAAIARDIGIIRLRDGEGVLNFEHLRSEYKTYLSQRFRPDEEIFYKRGPIKSIIAHFLPKIIKNP